MLPTVGTDTLKIVWYAAEVAGRTLGVASMVNLVPDPARRAALEASGNRIATAVQETAKAYVTRVVFEYVDQRITVGRGRGVDRGFDAVISTASETVRTSLPDRSTSNPDYRAVFPHGADEYTSPTIKEDEEIAVTLRKAVSDSSLSVKTDVLGLLDAVIPVVAPAATDLRSGEKKVNALFQTELNGRKQIVDVLWEERKAIENALGRGGRGLSRFIFFDFRPGAAAEAPEDAPTPSPEPPK